MADIFDDKKFDNATNNGGGKFALAGSYPKIKINALKNVDTRDGKASILEYDIIESNVPECPPGSGYSYVMKVKHDSYYSNIRRCISELTGAEFEKVDRAVCKGVTSEAQPLAGTIAQLTVRNVPTKNSGGTKDYSKHFLRLIEKSAMMKQFESAAA